MKRNKPQYDNETIRMAEQIGATEFEGIFKVCAKILMVFEVLLVCNLLIKYKQLTGIYTLYFACYIALFVSCAVMLVLIKRSEGLVEDKKVQQLKCIEVMSMIIMSTWSVAITFVDAYAHQTMDVMIYVIVMALMPTVMFIKPYIGITIQVIMDVIIVIGMVILDPMRIYYLSINFFSFCFVSAVVYYIIYSTKEKLYLREVELMKASQYDDMTKLANRRCYENELSQLRKMHHDRAYIMMIFDIDGLKETNDTKGHNAGDELIKGAAECIKKAFGEGTKCFRIGGDEFAAIMTKDKAQDKLEVLLEKFEAYCKSWEGEHIPEISISYGYADAEENNEMSVDDLIVLADQQMYKMKETHYENELASE